MRKRFIFVSLIIVISIIFFIGCAPAIFHQNNGSSISIGASSNGSLSNAYILDYKSDNVKYFSPISYYLMGDAYLNSKVYKTLDQAYQECQITCPDIHFRIMECSEKDGGKMPLHRTHRNGLSVDFMVPKIKNGHQIRLYDRLGLWHYLLDFDEHGKLNINDDVSIDFETMGKHIIALDNAAKKNGLGIRIVILKINLKDDLFKTESGKELKRRGIYFAQSLQANVDMMHDDHYHIDFKIKR